MKESFHAVCNVPSLARVRLFTAAISWATEGHSRDIDVEVCRCSQGNTGTEIRTEEPITVSSTYTYHTPYEG